jgi:hypothetical protein
MSKKIDVVIKDIPDVIRQSVGYAVANFTVGLLRIDETPSGPNLTLLGSGTLVSVKSIHAILTAHHVLQALPDNGRLGLVLSDRTPAPTISVDGLRYVEIARGSVESEGPDLGAVVMSPAIAADLRAKKSFYNLDIQHEMFLHSPPVIQDGLWFLHGFVAERTEEFYGIDGYKKTMIFHQQSSSGMVEPGYTVGRYDYFVLRVSYSGNPIMPRKFGGTSGGGLWQVRLSRRNSDGEYSHERPILSGVAFYQDDIVAEETGIRCHGIRSVYDVAYEAIRKAA